MLLLRLVPTPKRLSARRVAAAVIYVYSSPFRHRTVRISNGSAASEALGRATIPIVRDH